MANRVTGWVWHNSHEKGNARLVLLALADCAHPDGDGAWPSIETLAGMTLLSERAIRYLLRDLERRGSVQVRIAAGPNRTNVWRVVMPEEGARFAPLGGGKKTRGGGNQMTKRGQQLLPPNRTTNRHIEPLALRAEEREGYAYDPSVLPRYLRESLAGSRR